MIYMVAKTWFFILIDMVDMKSFLGTLAQQCITISYENWCDAFVIVMFKSYMAEPKQAIKIIAKFLSLLSQHLTISGKLTLWLFLL